MRKKQIAVWLTVSIMLLALAGCGAEQAEQNAAPKLAEYYNGVINTEGRVILARSDDFQQFYILDNEVLYDRWYASCYALQVENRFVGEPPVRLEPAEDRQTNEFADGTVVYLDYGWDQSISGRTFRFYDVYGELLQTVDIAAEVHNPYCVQFYFAPDGDLQNSVFVVDQLAIKGCYQLLDYAGNLLAEKNGLPGSGVKVTLAPEFVAVQYSITESGDYLDLYTLDGQPMPTEHKYFDFEQLSFNHLPPDERQLFYKARYTNEDGRRRYDILDGHGNVVQGNLLGLESDYGGVYYATQGWGNLTSCWLDLRSGQPVWLTEEPENIDYYGLYWEEEERLIAAMPNRGQYNSINRIYRDNYAHDWYPSPYFDGRRLLKNGVIADVLDEKGNVLISGVEPWALRYLGDDLFIVEQGFSRGLMNIKGEWLYKESAFTEFED